MYSVHPRLDLVNFDLVKYVLDLMNKLQLPFSYFTLYPDSILVNRLNLVNKRGLTTTFTKSSFGCTHNKAFGTCMLPTVYNKINFEQRYNNG